MSVVEIPELVRASISGQTYCAKVHEENLGMVHHASTKFGDLLVVADAVGDGGRGSQASRIAVDIISSRVAGMLAFFPPEIAVEEAVRQANAELAAASTTSECSQSCIGVEVVVALLRMDTDRAFVTIAHVGEGRAYLASKRKLTLLTGEPSAQSDVLDREWTMAHHEEPHPDRTTPTPYLGQGLNIKVAMSELQLEAGDTLLLCSDGLWRTVSQQDIERVLSDQTQSAEEACRALLDLARDAGGHENVAIEITRLTQGGETRANVRLILDEQPIVAPLSGTALPAPIVSNAAAEPVSDGTGETDELPGHFPHRREAGDAASELRNPAPLQDNAGVAASVSEISETSQVEIPLFRSFQGDIDVEGEQKKSSRWLMIASTLMAIPMLCVLVFLIDKAHSGAPFIEKQANQAAQAAGDAQPQSNAQDPSHRVKVTVDQAPAGPGPQPASSSQPDNNQQAGKPMQAQAATTSDQPVETTETPRGTRNQAAENVPAPAGSGRAEVNEPGGSNRNVNRDRVPSSREPASSAVAVSADAEAGRLMESRTPIYPRAARAEGIAGTVGLEATISKDGTVKDLRVVGGPVQLRQAALDSVRTWRYRPFMLNNEPTEVQTTINVVFSLNN